MGQAPARAGNVHEHVLQPEPPPDFPHANHTSVRPVLRPSRRKGASPPIRVSPSLFPPAVKVHLRRFVFRQACFRQRLCLRHHIEVQLVPRRFSPVPWQAHSVFVVRRKAPDLPPTRFRFQQISKWVLGLLTFQRLRLWNCQIASPRINMLKNGVGARRQRKFARGATPGRKQKCAHGQPQQNKCSFHD